MFETSLVESSKRKGVRRWLSLPLSLLVHAAVIGSAMAASVWFVGDVGDPPTRVVFGSLLPQPPPGTPEKPAGGRTPPQKASEAAPAVAPPAIPSSVPLAPEMPEGPTTSGFDDGSRVPGGDPESDQDEIGPGLRIVTRPPAPQPILRPGGDVTEPLEISRVQPDYPESARKARMQGTVVLEAVISRNGSVESVRILRSVNPILDASAVKAVSRWRYEPARFDGRTVPVYLTVTVRFQLE